MQFIVQPDEYLTKICGLYGDQIKHLAFVTNKRAFRPVPTDTKSGTPEHGKIVRNDKYFVAPEDVVPEMVGVGPTEIKGFFGRVDENLIYAIGVSYIRRPLYPPF